MKAIRRVFVVAVVAACAWVGYSQTNAVLGWAAPVSVTAQAVAVRLRVVNIGIQADGKFVVNVAWEWLDSAGRVVRNGTAKYTEAQIAAKLAARGTNVETFKALFLSIAQEEAAK